MNKLLLSVFAFITLSHNVNSQVFISDINFRTTLKIKYPTCFSGDILDTICAENAIATTIDISNLSISSIRGIHFFKKLTYVKCNNNLLTSIDSLPKQLTIINCSDNQINNIGSLPSTLLQFICSNNQLTSLPALPASLQYLICVNNQLTSLPVLPNSLLNLWCKDNALISLPSLPNSLTAIECSNNDLTTLPALPNSLHTLSCSYNQLTSLPQLPSSIQHLISDYNPINSLPTFPNSLLSLSFVNTEITSLPTLPDALINLNVRGTNLNCLPFLPSPIEFLDFSGTTITCLPNKPFAIQSEYANFPVCTPSYLFIESVSAGVGMPIQNGCQSFPMLSGKIYYDLNNNSQYDSNEPLAQNLSISLPERSISTRTNSNGFYDLYVDTIGDLDLETVVPKYYSLSPNISNITFSSYGQQLHQDFALQIADANIKDVVTTLSNLNPARPGFNISFKINYSNNGTLSTATDLLFEYPSAFIIDSISRTPDQSLTNKISWSLGNLNPGETGVIFVYGKILANTTLGETILFESSVNKSIPDEDAYFIDNISIKNMIVVGAYDPNDKTATPLLTPDQVLSGDYIYYTIRFQNTGTDTAFTVIVVDTLENKLDINSLEIINTSHNCNLNSFGNIIFFAFYDINLEDQTHNEPASHGFIDFRVKPKNSVVLNDIIKNKAAIFFDFNSPIITNEAETRIGYTLGLKEEKVSQETNLFYPNPASSYLQLYKNGRARIYSTNGLLVIDKQIADNMIDISSLPKGLYLLKITDANAEEMVDKFIKE